MQLPGLLERQRLHFIAHNGLEIAYTLGKGCCPTATAEPMR